jgi:hypothetical protein
LRLTSHLLADHQSNGKKSTVSVARNGPHLPHQVLEAGITDQSAFVVKLILDLCQLASDVRVSRRKSTDKRKDIRGLVPTVLTGQPTRRFVTEPHRSKQQHGRKTLHDERDDVLRVARNVSVRAVVDPEGQHDTGSDEELVNSGQATTNGTRSVLGDWTVGQ